MEIDQQKSVTQEQNEDWPTPEETFGIPCNYSQCGPQERQEKVGNSLDEESHNIRKERLLNPIEDLDAMASFNNTIRFNDDSDSQIFKPAYRSVLLGAPDSTVSPRDVDSDLLHGTESSSKIMIPEVNNPMYFTLCPHNRAMSSLTLLLESLRPTPMNGTRKTHTRCHSMNQVS